MLWTNCSADCQRSSRPKVGVILLCRLRILVILRVLIKYRNVHGSKCCGSAFVSMRIRILVRLLRHKKLYFWMKNFLYVSNSLIGHKTTYVGNKVFFLKAGLEVNLLFLVNFLLRIRIPNTDPDPQHWRWIPYHFCCKTSYQFWSAFILNVQHHPVAYTGWFNFEFWEILQNTLLPVKVFSSNFCFENHYLTFYPEVVNKSLFLRGGGVNGVFRIRFRINQRWFGEICVSRSRHSLFMDLEPDPVDQNQSGSETLSTGV